MLVYLIMLLSVYIFASGTVADDSSTIGIAKGNINNRVIFSVIVIILGLVNGLRYRVGTDYSTYRGLFKYYMTLDVKEAAFQSEGAFWGVAATIGKVTSNVNWVFLVFAFIIVLLMVYGVAEYSSDFAFSIFLFITMMDYFYSFNGIRQSVATSILFAGSVFIKDKKWIKYFIIVLIAACFHKSALFMIFVYFFVTRKAWSRVVLIASGVISLAALFFSSLIGSFFQLLEGSDYQHFMVFSAEDDGINIFRVLVCLVPVVLSFIYRKSMYEDIDDDDANWLDILTNFALLCFLIALFARRITVLYRLTMYMSTYSALLIPRIVPYMTKNYKLSRVLVMALFLVYMILLLPHESNLLPYNSILFM